MIEVSVLMEKKKKPLLAKTPMRCFLQVCTGIALNPFSFLEKKINASQVCLRVERWRLFRLLHDLRSVSFSNTSLAVRFGSSSCWKMSLVDWPLNPLE